MIRRPLTGLGVLVVLGVVAFLATAVAQSAHEVDALDPRGNPPADDWIWEPGIQDGAAGTIEAQPGESVTWNFDKAGDPHDLWLNPPDGDPVQLSQGCSDGPNPDWCFPDSESITHEFRDDAAEGTYVYYCTLHSGNPEGTDGMSGKVVIGDDGGNGPNRLPNPTEVGAPWEFGTEPPRLRNVLIRGVNRGIRLRARLSHPGKVIVRVRRGGRVVLTRRYRDVAAGAFKPKITGNRLRRGRHLVVVRARDKWGQKARPLVTRERIWVNY